MIKVLIVDDEQIGRDSLKALLATCGFEAHSAANCTEALDVAARCLPDVVIVDWLLADRVDGLRVAEALREILPAVRIVMISGDPSVKSSAPRDAGYAILMKPFQIAELLAVLDSTDGPA